MLLFPLHTNWIQKQNSAFFLLFSQIKIVNPVKIVYCINIQHHGNSLYSSDAARRLAFMSTIDLDTLLDSFAIWKCDGPTKPSCTGVSTGFATLDNLLPGGGWPQEGLTELLTDRPGIGELSLLLPALASLSRQRGVLMIAPPFLPYAPALVQAGVYLPRVLILQSCSMRDALACAETALRSGGCGAVLIWEHGPGAPDEPAASKVAGTGGNRNCSISPVALRRLHLAAQRGNAMAVAFRAVRHAATPSPAVLRMTLHREMHGLRLRVFKRRGLSGDMTLSLDPYLDCLRSEMSIHAVPSLPVSTLDHTSVAEREEKERIGQAPGKMRHAPHSFFLAH